MGSHERRFFTIFVLPIITIGVIATMFVIMGSTETARRVGLAGTPLLILVNILYIWLIDSPQRWPSVSAWERLKRIMNFAR